jgi:hypothetical protein
MHQRNALAAIAMFVLIKGAFDLLQLPTAGETVKTWR